MTFSFPFAQTVANMALYQLNVKRRYPRRPQATFTTLGSGHYGSVWAKNRFYVYYIVSLLYVLGQKLYYLIFTTFTPGVHIATPHDHRYRSVAFK